MHQAGDHPSVLPPAPLLDPHSPRRGHLRACQARLLHRSGQAHITHPHSFTSRPSFCCLGLIQAPTEAPTRHPSSAPTIRPTLAPSEGPTRQPSTVPTTAPSESPSRQPTGRPSTTPTEAPSTQPSKVRAPLDCWPSNSLGWAEVVLSCPCPGSDADAKPSPHGRPHSCSDDYPVHVADDTAYVGAFAAPVAVTVRGAFSATHYASDDRALTDPEFLADHPANARPDGIAYVSVASKTDSLVTT
jgi:hypothetical protein